MTATAAAGDSPQQQALFEPVTVHCFFQRWCKHTVQNIDPYVASREMEAHHAALHYGVHLDVVYRDVERGSGG